MKLKFDLEHEKEEQQKELEEARLKFEKEKLKWLKEKEEIEKKKDDVEKEKECVEKEKYEIEQKYMTILEKLAEQNLSSTMIQNNNIKSCNLFYISNKFNSAFNYEDLLDPKMTDDEQLNMLENGLASACYDFLKGRCIDNITLDKRPFHCVDDARKKIILRTNDSWLVDRRGEELLKQLLGKIKE